MAIGKGTETEHNREKFERLLGGLPQVDLTEPIVTDDRDFVERIRELPGCDAFAVDHYALDP